MRTIFFAMLLCFSLVTHAAPPFIFTAIPDQNETVLVERYSSVAEYLSKTLGIDVRYVPVTSYDASVAAFRNNQVQLAWFGGLSGVRARLLVKDSQAIAQGDTDRAFQTYFIAHVSSGLNPSENFPADIAGKSFSFGSKGSTSGRLMPEYYIREHFKKSPAEVFSRVGFSGSHSLTLEAVRDGVYQVGVLNFNVWNKAIKDGIVDPEKVKVIWKTPTYPDYQWTVRGDVDKTWGEGFTQRLTQVLLDIKDPKIMEAFGRTRFIPAANDDYKPILETAKNIGLLR